MMQAEAAATAAISAATGGSFELWVARTWIFLPAMLSLFIMGCAFAVASNYIKVWKRDGFNDVSSNLWVALTVAMILELPLFAVMDVGQALVLLTEGWGAIVGICSTVLLPLLGYKAVTKITTPKGGTVESSSTETISTSRSSSSGNSGGDGPAGPPGGG